MTADRPAWVIEQTLDAAAFGYCSDQDLLRFIGVADIILPEQP